VLACLPSFSFAIDPVSGAAALAGAIDAYGMAYGVGTVYDVSSSSGVSSTFEGLWDEFSSYQSNAGSQFDYDSYIDNYNQNRSLYGFDHSSGKFAAWSIDAESAEIFDQFWNWLLTGPAEMTRVDNEYFQFSSAQIGDNALPVNILSVLPYTPISKSSSSRTVLGLYGVSNNYYSIYQYNVLSEDVYVFVTTRQSTGNTSIYIVSQYSGVTCIASDPYQGYTLETSFTDANNPGIYYGYLDEGIFTSLTNAQVPVFPTAADGRAAIASFLADPSAFTDTIGVMANDDSGIVSLPNPYGLDYVPMPLEIVTNIPWDSSYEDTDEENGEPVPFPPVDVPLVVDDILTAISSEEYALEEDPQDPDPDPPPPAPSEVFVPLLPVGLPSFNFSFSGIWHYVREWVSSLGAWFTTLFTIWSALPYAMVVPVYATAVVVIVLGVYKRFFM